jgi:hypothetical protein
MGSAKKPTAQQVGNAQDVAADPEKLKRRQAAVGGLDALGDSENPQPYGHEAVYETPEETEAKLQARRLELSRSLKPDTADIVAKDLATGRVRRSRGGSTASALGQFSARRPLGNESALATIQEMS